MSVPRRAFLTALVVICLAGAGVSTAHATTELRRGDVGGDVLLWQRMLNYMTQGEHHLRDHVIGEDGIFGPKTEAATKRFERGAEFRRDGIVGLRERRRWMGAFITCCGAKKPTVALGSYGFEVGHAQLELNKWLRGTGEDLLMIDLLYGPATEEAVRRYQAAHHLAADGIVGPQTWGDLLGWAKR